jgi:hypothetical protein
LKQNGEENFTMAEMRSAWRGLLIFGAALAAAAAPAAGWAQAAASQIPQPPAMPTPHGPVVAFAVFNWLLTLLVVVLLVREAFRTRSLFPLAFLAGGALAGIVEPVFDGNIHVWFAQPPGDTPGWHFYNVPYPWYVIPGNAVLGGPVYWMYHKFRTGVSTRALWGWFFVWWAADVFQEIPGTTMGAYAYYGPHPFVVSGYPVWIGMMAGLGLPLAGYAAYKLREVATGARLWVMQAVLMPVVIYGCEVVTWPMWDALNGGQTVAVTRVAALVSLAFTLVAYSFLTLAYARQRAGAPAEAQPAPAAKAAAAPGRQPAASAPGV